METPRDLGDQFPSALDYAYREYKRHLRILEIMSKEVATIPTDASMHEAAKIMGQKHIGSIIAVKYETAVGIVTERDLLTKVLAKGIDPYIRVESVMSYPLITICPTAEIRDAARVMIGKKGRLVVYECGNLVGIITAADLIRSLPQAAETLSKVDDFMTKKIVTADEKTSVASVVRTLGEERIGSVITTRQGKPIGIFTERDLLTTFLATGRSLNTEVGAASSSPLITAPSGTSVHQAAYIMTSRHIRRLPIAKDNRLLGIVTARDLVEAYAK